MKLRGRYFRGAFPQRRKKEKGAKDSHDDHDLKYSRSFMFVCYHQRSFVGSSVVIEFFFCPEAWGGGIQQRKWAYPLGSNRNDSIVFV